MATDTAEGSAAAQAHIAAQARLQVIAAAGVAAAWDNLPHYNEEDVPGFLAVVVPFILAAQRQSVALTNAFLARVMGRAPLGLDVERLTGEAIRTATPAVVEAGGLPADATGVPPGVVYRRPFVNVWSDLGNGKPWQEAVAGGRQRAIGNAAMDVQNAMRHTLVAVGGADDLILGFRRVPNPDACPLCKLASGRRYRTHELLPIHTHCRCGIDVVTTANRDDFTGNRANDLALQVTPDGLVAVTRVHGELGPLIVPGGDHFATEADFQIAA